MPTVSKNNRRKACTRYMASYLSGTLMPHELELELEGDLDLENDVV